MNDKTNGYQKEYYTIRLKHFGHNCQPEGFTCHISEITSNELYSKENHMPGKKNSEIK